MSNLKMNPLGRLASATTVFSSNKAAGSPLGDKDSVSSSSSSSSLLAAGALPATSVAAQNKLNAMSDKFDGRTPVRIHFLDNSSKLFLLNDNVEVKDFLVMILTKFTIKNADYIYPYFGVFVSLNGVTIDRSMNLNENVCEYVHNNFKNEKTKFVFMIRLFVPAIWGLTSKIDVAKKLGKPTSMMSIERYVENAAVSDENLLYLQFIQAIYNVITCHYPSTIDQAIGLAAVQFLHKFGEFREATHRAGFLGSRVVEFVPIKHVKARSHEQLEAAILDKVRECAPGLSTYVQVQKEYMNTVYSLPCFGQVYYKCRQKSSKKLPESLVLGVHATGVTLYDKSRTVIAFLHLKGLLRWGYTKTVFYVEAEDVKRLGADTIEFEVDNPQPVSDLVSDYALAFLRDQESSAEGVEGEGSDDGAAPTSSSADRKSINARGQNKVAAGKPVGKVQPSYKELKHVVKLQALWRGYRLRSSWIREDASIIIQCCWRGYRGRCRVTAIIEELLASGEFSLVDK